MDVLILHGVDFGATGRLTSINHIKCFERYSTGHRFVYQHFAQPVTPALRAMRFDAVLMDPLFLGVRWVDRSDVLRRIQDKFAFVAQSALVKVALPQDDYDHSDVLDDWLARLETDLVYTPMGHRGDLFYRRTQSRAKIISSLTGYIEESDLERAARWASRGYEERQIDVGYRARDLPAQFGRFGRLKAEFGLAAARAIGDQLVTDISVSEADTLAGEDWPRFLGNCRFVLGTLSGSSVIDPDGSVRSSIRAFLAQRPDASFEDVAAACLDRREAVEPYSGPSPRLFEAAVMGAGQILAPGQYLDLVPGDHYIELDAEMTAIADVIARVRDVAAAKKMIGACHAALVGSGRYRYSTWSAEVLDEVAQLVEARGGPVGDRRFEELAVAHDMQSRRIGAAAVNAWTTYGPLDATLRGLKVVLGPARRHLPAGLRRAVVARLTGRAASGA